MTTTTTPAAVRVHRSKLTPCDDATIKITTRRLTITVDVIFETQDARDEALAEIRDTYHADLDDMFATFAQFRPRPRIQILTQ